MFVTSSLLARPISSSVLRGLGSLSMPASALRSASAGPIDDSDELAGVAGAVVATVADEDVRRRRLRTPDHLLAADDVAATPAALSAARTRASRNGTRRSRTPVAS